MYVALVAVIVRHTGFGGPRGHICGTMVFRLPQFQTGHEQRPEALASDCLQLMMHASERTSSCA